MLAGLYDAVLKSMEAGALRQWRHELLAPLSGRVLEVGAGTGLNLNHYTRDVEELILLEPDPQMRPALKRRLVAGTDARRPTIVAGGIEDLEEPPGSFDAVVSTLVLCTVPDPLGALHECRRLLKEDGVFVFIEHVAAPPKSSRRRWQHIIEPVWKRCAGNCHLTRQTEARILEAGFTFDEITRESMRKAAPFLRPSIRGRARVAGTR